MNLRRSERWLALILVVLFPLLASTRAANRDPGSTPQRESGYSYDRPPNNALTRIATAPTLAVSGSVTGQDQALIRSGPSQVALVVAAETATAQTPAQALGDAVRTMVPRPNTVAVLETPSGGITAGGSGSAFAPELQPALRSALDAVPANQYGGLCAEIACINNALSQGLDVEGGQLTTSQVRGLGSTSDVHGTPIEPCSVCGPVLKSFGINYWAP